MRPLSRLAQRSPPTLGWTHDTSGSRGGAADRAGPSRRPPGRLSTWHATRLRLAQSGHLPGCRCVGATRREGAWSTRSSASSCWSSSWFCCSGSSESRRDRGAFPGSRRARVARASSSRGGEARRPRRERRWRRPRPRRGGSGRGRSPGRSRTMFVRTNRCCEGRKPRVTVNGRRGRATDAQCRR